MTAPSHSQTLPRGRHAPPREVVWESQRGRMLAAMADATAEKGYGNVAVADVIARARVSRKTFYEHFANKEACFLAAYDAGVDLLLGAIEAAVEAAGPDPLAAAEAGTRCYLEMLAANPSLARTFLVEVFAAGPAALERHAAVHERFAERLATNHRAAREQLPALPDHPSYVFRACVGAVNELVVDEVRRTGPDALPALLGAVIDIELRLLAGDALAAQLRGR
jgi:AcrR family transcriptional regulator